MLRLTKFSIAHAEMLVGYLTASSNGARDDLSQKCIHKEKSVLGILRPSQILPTNQEELGNSDFHALQMEQSLAVRLKYRPA